MTLEAPMWMQNNGYAARIDRMLLAQLWDEGVIDLTAFKVTQRGAGANFSVDVALGEAVVTGDDQTNQGNYLARSIATINAVVSAAPGSNSRYDIVCLRMNDPNAGGSAGNTATIVVTAGTPAASPTIPATPASSLLLAVLGPIATATASITTGIISDSRVVAGRRAAPGTIEWSANSAAASGWLFAAGQAVSRTTYARLFAHVSTTFGSGDGSTTFNLPDLRGRGAIGVDNMNGTDAGRLSVSNAIGTSGGTETVTLAKANLPTHVHGPGTLVPSAHAVTDPSHSHGVTDAGHVHAQRVVATNGTFLAGSYRADYNADTTTPNLSLAQGADTLTANTGISINSGSTGVTVSAHTISGDTENGSADTLAASAVPNMHPYLLLNAFIRT